jgi:hypothetical protein
MISSALTHYLLVCSAFHLLTTRPSARHCTNCYSPVCSAIHLLTTHSSSQHCTNSLLAHLLWAAPSWSYRCTTFWEDSSKFLHPTLSFGFSWMASRTKRTLREARAGQGSPPAPSAQLPHQYISCNFVALYFAWKLKNLPSLLSDHANTGSKRRPPTSKIYHHMTQSW